jgi:hypothetical protein
MVDKGDIATLSFFMGGLFGIGWMSFHSIPNWESKYKELLRYTKNLIELQDGIVTVADLTLKAEVSPAKASKFLKKLALQLEMEPEVDDTGTIYYIFNTGKTIFYQRQLKDHS